MIGTGWVDVSEGLLRELLKAPPDSLIVGAELGSPGVIRLLFVSDELPTVPEGAQPLAFTPTVEVVPGGHVWSWGDGR